MRNIFPILITSLSIVQATFLCSCSPSKTKSSQSVHEDLIRKARMKSNVAIATKDTMAIADPWMDNFLIITSRDFKVEGKEENRKSFANEFKTKDEVIYVRTPNKISVMESWLMASEEGIWEGSWKENDGKIKIGGTYYAKWHYVNDQWMLRAEIYTPTYCSGGNYCQTQPIN